MPRRSRRGVLKASAKHEAPPTEVVAGLCDGGGRIRTFEDRSRQIYSLLPLTAWLLHPLFTNLFPVAIVPRAARADGENRTRNRLITNQVLCQLSYVSQHRLPSLKT